MDFKDISLNEFSKLLSDKVSIPGGGGASALVSALAASLSMMAGNLSISKEANSENDIKLKAFLEETEQIRLELIDCIDYDALVFEPLSKAYKLPEGSIKDERMEKCLKDAAQVPLKVEQLCAKVIDLSMGYYFYGKETLLSDVGCSVIFAWAGIYASVLNVRANTKLMKDRQYADYLNEKSDDIMNIYWKKAEKVYNMIYERLK